MKIPWKNLEGPARLLLICLTVLLIAGGLCGLQFVLSASLYGRRMPSFFMLIGILELIAILVSGLVAIGALIAWLIQRLRSGS
jgi:hypothetical protein